MHDVERSVVSRVVLIGVKRAGGVERVRVRVDVEVTLHLTRNHIHRLSEGSRRTLLTERSVADEVESEYVTELESRVEVAGVTRNGTLFCPTRILHHRKRRVIGGVL